METVADSKISGIGQIGIVVNNLDEATKFYRDMLSIRYLFTASEMAFFQLGDIRLMLTQATGSQLRHPASILYYRVADIDAAYAELRGNGVHFVESPAAVYRADGKELWLAFFNDMDSNVLALMSERPASA